MKSIIDKDTVQIEITNACTMRCSNCTRLVGHHKKPYIMDMETFKKCVDSLVDYPKMVGIMGGEPLIHPQFEEMCLYLHSKIPRERCGLWSLLPKGKEKYAPLIAKVFGSVLLNDHSRENIKHGPILVSVGDYIKDEFDFWYHVDHCWMQNCWSASVNPKGAFFCEVAAAMDITFNGPGGWPIEKGWWKKTPKDYIEQMERYCRDCGVAFNLHARMDTENIDDVSPRMYEKLKAIDSPKLKRGRVSIYSKGINREKQDINSFRDDVAYARKVAAKYNLELDVKPDGFLSPRFVGQS